MGKTKDKITEKVQRANIRLHSLIAGDYDDRQAVFHPVVVANLKELIAPYIETSIGNKFLDVGCGTGYAARLVENYDFEVTGFDITPEMIKRARQNLPDGIFVVADAGAVPFRQSAFDVVAISGVLHHLAHYEPALRAAAVCVKPGGLLLILNEPCVKGYRRFRQVRRFTKKFLPESRVKKHTDSGLLGADEELLAEYHVNFSDGIDPKKVKAILESENFSVEQIQYTDLNMIANLGDRLYYDILKRLQQIKHGNIHAAGFDFNLIAIRWD